MTTDSVAIAVFRRDCDRLRLLRKKRRVWRPPSQEAIPSLHASIDAGR